MIAAVITAFAMQSLFYFLLLILPLNDLASYQFLLILEALTLAALVACRTKYIHITIIDALHFFAWEGKIFECRDGNGLRPKILRSAYRFTLLLICGSVLISSALNAAPGNYDSNTYNLARIPAMIADGSPFLLQISSGRQAVLPLAHDILYLPDIIFGNLRGYGLISSFEFICLAGVTIQSILVMAKALTLAKGRVGKDMVHVSLITGLLLLATSDIQTMQSISTKNDLVITLLFMSGFCISLLFFVNEISVGWLLSIGFIITSLGISSKGYGVICTVPVIGAVLLKKTEWSSLRFPLKKPLLSMSGGELLIRSIRDIKQICGRTEVHLAMISTLLLVMHFAIDSFSRNYHSSTLGMINEWTYKSIPMHLFGNVAILNIGRNLASLILYPIMIVPFAGNIIKGLIDRSYVGVIFKGDFGTGGGTSYEWPSYGGDVSHSTIPFLTLIIASLATFLFAYKASNFFLPFHRRRVALRSLLLYTLFNCIFSFVIISSAILYQPWIGRFLGVSYICLIPINAILIGCFVSQINFQRVPKLFRNAVIVVTLACILSKFYSHLMIASVEADIRYFLSSSMSSTKLEHRRHVHHVTGVAKSDLNHDDLLYLLRYLPFNKRVVCAQEDTWTFMPLFLSIHNNSFNGNNLSMLSANECPDISALDISGLNPNVYIEKNSKTEYVFLN